MSVSTCVASLARQFRCPEIQGEKRAKTGWLGGWGAGVREIRLLAVLLSVFSSQMQVLSHGLWVLCAEMGVAWHILGAGEVSEQ